MGGESSDLPDEVVDRVRSIQRRGALLGVVTGLTILGIYCILVWFVGGWILDTAAPDGAMRDNLHWYGGYLLLIIVVAQIATSIMLLVSREIPSRYMYYALKKLDAEYSADSSTDESE